MTQRAHAKSLNRTVNRELVLKHFPEAENVLETMVLLFDGDYYLQQGEPNEPDLLLDYLVHGVKTGRNPHPLFSTKYYCRRNPDVDEAVNPLLHYCKFGHLENRTFHPLFDGDWYRRQYVDSPLPPNTNLLEHYLDQCGEVSPTPLFCPKWYRDANPDLRNTDPLCHYLKHGWREGRRSHWAFDEKFFRSQISTELRDSEPLTTYLAQNAKADPHPLFSCSWYLANNPDIAKSNLDPFVHYLRAGYRERRSFHPLLDGQRYRSGNNDRLPNDTCLIRHYTENGWQDERPPTRLFDAELYLELYPDVKAAGIDPFMHYLTSGWTEGRRPHAGFDPSHYLKREPSLTPGIDNPLVAFATAKPEDRKRPVPWFDAQWYKEHVGMDWASKCPNEHYVALGLTQGVPAGPIRSDSYIYASCNTRSFIEERPMRGYVASKMNLRQRLLFVLEDGRNTQFNVLVLDLLRRISSTESCECFLVLNGDGPLIKEMEHFAHIYAMRHRNPKSLDIEREVEHFLSLIDRPPAACISGPGNIEHLRQAFAKKGINSIVVAYGSPYQTPLPILESVAKAHSVLFPSRQALEIAESRLGGHFANFQVLRPACPERYQSFDIGDEFHEQLGLPDNARIVVGGGSNRLESGSDLFAQVAVDFLKNHPSSDVYFVWTGDCGSSPVMDYAKQVSSAVEFTHNIRFIDNICLDQCLKASTVYFHSARSDFLCIGIAEATEAGVPTVAFEDSGSAEEMISNSDELVAMGNITAMSKKIAQLLGDSSCLQAARQKTRKSKEPGTAFLESFFSCIREASGNTFTIPPEKTRGPKIFLTTPDWSISGVNTFVLHLIRQLDAKGRDVQLLFTRGRFTNVDDNHLPDVPSRFLQPRSQSAPDIWSTLRRYMVESQPCVFIPNYDYYASAITPGLPDGVSALGILHSDDPDHYEHFYRLGRYWQRIVAVSSQIKERASEYNKSLSSKLSVIHYGIPYSDRPMRSLRATKGKPDPIKLLYSGRIVQKQKRILDFIPLCNALESLNVEYQLTFLGDGEASQLLESGLAHLVRNGRVTLAGRVRPEEVEAYCLDADAFVLLSDFEGLPLSLLEAMECGTIPVVTEMDSGIPEVIENRKNGFILPKSDFLAVAEVIKMLQQNPERRQELAEATRRSLKALKLTDTAMAEQYIRLIDQVLEESANGSKRAKPLAGNQRFAATLPPPGMIYHRLTKQ